jgi:hypothetical protein
MSSNIRTIWILASAVFASWLAVRSLAASPEPVLDDPPVPMAMTTRLELPDAALAELIKSFATQAHAPRHDAR